MASDYEFSGLLFPNKRKEAEKQPDYTGKATINGKEWRIAGWKRTGQSGSFLSLKFSEPRGGREDGPTETRKEPDDTW